MVVAASGSPGMQSAAPLLVCRLRRPALPAAPGSWKAGARYGLPDGRRSALPVSALRAEVSGLPGGVKPVSTSQRVNGLAVMLYLIPLSYAAVAPALDALGTYLCKRQVCKAVQAPAKQVPGMKRRQEFGAVRTPALGADVTSVK